MYAVIQTGGKQYRVEEGQMLAFEKLPGEPGAEIELDRVLLVGGDGAVQVGAPLVAGAKVVGEIVRQQRGPKIRMYTYKRRKGQSRRMGHRQDQTLVRIRRIAAPA